jgi:uncharacterized protein YcbK (DUF882 family)
MVAVTLRSRREVLRFAGGLAASVMFGVRGAAAATRAADRVLSLYSVNTGEHLAVQYFADGAYRPDSMTAVSRLLRDHLTDQAHAIDPTLLDQLFVLRSALETQAAFHVVCGYRSPETNALKRRQHHGVAGHSFHLAGRAVDVFLPDRDLRQLRTAALRLEAGGVGYYPRSDFVHLDTGPIRTW